jgi:phosphoenolpyruvate carboxylase
MIATLEHGMHPPMSPLPEWRSLMDEMCVAATKEYRRMVFTDPEFIKNFHMVHNEVNLTCT